MSTQNPTVPKNHNALLSASGWGAIYVKVKSVDHGMNVVTDLSTQRYSRTIYIKTQISDSFTLAIVCSSSGEYDALGEWVRGYARAASDPDGSVGPVHVVVPSRNFDKIAVPNSMTFGDFVEAVTYKVSIGFVGASDPVPHLGDLVSSFSLPTGDPDLPYYYPSGLALGGSVDTLYDQTNLDRANAAATDRLTAQYEAWAAAQSGTAWQNDLLDRLAPGGE